MAVDTLEVLRSGVFSERLLQPELEQVDAFGEPRLDEVGQPLEHLVPGARSLGRVPGDLVSQWPAAGVSARIDPGR